MTSSSSAKAPCATCDNKGVGIFKCEGCAQVFCRKHVIEHRDILSHQLDEIVLEYDILQQTIVENKDKKNHRHPLIKQTDKWERDSIEKIRQTADEARQQIQELIGSQKGTMSKELHDLAQRLQKAREDDDYVETDLRTWTTTLEKLKHDMNAVSPSINICQDPTTVFIAKIYLPSINQNLTQEERFGQFFGNIRIEENGCMTTYSGSRRSNAQVRGRNEYSKGQHKIRFIINKQTAFCVMSFGIASKSRPMSKISFGGSSSMYGWYTDDRIVIHDENRPAEKGFIDLRGETIQQLVFFIDCDNRNISYFNERTGNTREMNINIDKCPFPWQLEFYLFDIGDRVQLISSNQVL